jgi:hypothetical protein
VRLLFYVHSSLSRHSAFGAPSGVSIRYRHLNENLLGMAKASSSRTAGPARIRFIMVDAEIPDGDLTHITHAIQNALRPQAGPLASHRAIAAPPQRGVEQNGHLDSSEIQAVDDEAQTVAPAPGGNAPLRPARKPRVSTPKVLEIDLNAEPSFLAFADQKQPSSHPKRCLVAAVWLKEARGIEVFNEDHIYTCYRKAKWPTTVKDFRQLLRNLKHDQQIVSRDDGYAINHLGEAEVEKLGAA